MRASRKTVGAFAFGVVMGLVAAGCQTYDFEPVEPISIGRQETAETFFAVNLKPNVMLLVDKSGSMDLPVDTTDPDCSPGGVLCGKSSSGTCNTAVCPTRWSELQTAMQAFLVGGGNSSAFLRLGLTSYPQPAPSASDACVPTQSVMVQTSQDEVDSALQSHAANVWDRINDIQTVDTTSYGDDRTGGGTPTALSLRYLRENVASLGDSSRDNFAIVLTDGLPNCNANHAPFDPANPSQCTCTLDDIELTPGNKVSGCSPQFGFQSKGCLDETGSVAEVQALKAMGVTTIVVGFGAETASGPGPATLQAMAVAGGFERICAVNADCGTGQTCNNGACSQSFFQAANGAELATALEKIGKAIIRPEPCRFELQSSPSDERLLSVKINDEVIARESGGTVNWTFQAGSGTTKPAVLFQGAKCDLIKASTKASPVKVSVVVVQTR
ncbi:MAG: adventurous gliding motility lipoprotein CglB [Myxococcaceae bacterium]|nr:adventurous gliding motility lipoprotein CglB [Myxococcaceae bacterium]MCI0669726.1 adventurous gliding motility lipoprotein CglB [Myxococcaceae bacterium]